MTAWRSHALNADAGQRLGVELAEALRGLFMAASRVGNYEGRGKRSLIRVRNLVLIERGGRPSGTRKPQVG